MDGDRPAAQPACPARSGLHAAVQAAGQVQANALDYQASAKFNAGNNAGDVGDNYVRITVFLAAVLFLVGIGSSFQLPSVRYALIASGFVLLVFSVVLIAQQPGPPA